MGVVPAVRYRIAHPLPPRLEYAGATYALEIVKQRHDAIPVDEWVFRARRVGAGTVCVIASSLALRSRLAETLDHGFEVQRGSPADRVMARLTRDGIAVAMRPSRR